MNIKRGLFRIWVLLTVFFVLAMVGIGYGEVVQQLERQAEETYVNEHKTPLLPVVCYKARGQHGADYQWPPGRESQEDYRSCWYELTAFRRNFPEYGDIPDAALVEKTRKEAYFGVYPSHPWTVAGQFLLAAVAIPLGILLVGSAIYWALAGFARNPQPER